MMYDFYSVRQRKNPEGTIEAFSRAFDAGDQRAGLVIKMNNANADERALLESLIADRTNIHVIEETLDRSIVDSLMAATDCLVSLHRSEGFGLALAEAMALGRPVIATGWSGNTDYMRPTNSCSVGYSLVQLAEDYGPYRAGQVWADPDIDNAAWWMRELVKDPNEGARLGAHAANTIEEEFSAESVGTRIITRLHAVRTRGSWTTRQRVS
jgi:glycosyltransferase involved in cell wall biosynthesis